jgi:hypothetical protein
MLWTDCWRAGSLILRMNLRALTGLLSRQAAIPHVIVAIWSDGFLSSASSQNLSDLAYCPSEAAWRD